LQIAEVGAQRLRRLRGVSETGVPGTLFVPDAVVKRESRAEIPSEAKDQIADCRGQIAEVKTCITSLIINYMDIPRFILIFLGGRNKIVIED